MKKIKVYIKSVLFSLLFMLLSLLFLSTLYYFDILKSGLVTYLRPIIILLITFISSYQLGKKAIKNGYLEGIKFGAILIFSFIAISIIFFNSSIRLRIILYDIIIMSVSILGSMIGINKKS